MADEDIIEVKRLLTFMGFFDGPMTPVFGNTARRALKNAIASLVSDPPVVPDETQEAK